MAQYLISVWHDEDYEVDFSGEEMQRIGAHLGGGLMPARSATAMRPAGDGGVSMIDGPYAESKEIMGGFWVVEAADLDAALDWGRKAALACEGPVEVRPFQGE